MLYKLMCMEGKGLGGGGLEQLSLVAKMEERWRNQKNNLVASSQSGDWFLSLAPWTKSKSYGERKALGTKRLVKKNEVHAGLIRGQATNYSTL